MPAKKNLKSQKTKIKMKNFYQTYFFRQLIYIIIKIGFFKLQEEKERTKIITNYPQGLDKISKPRPLGIKDVNIKKYNLL